ncbi:GTPase Era [Candidatus Bodocaedibacter vickermanii]|uniref:GTPase Era n=2 Tax=cellular organisms TaxID=131567 RepID=A0A7L9RT51_9PROT|nr:GTPase Era [Candidatus Paracaedibacteraceae bacterium 'Lake Konstanz']
MSTPTQFGYVALIGLPNAGKSTLMNTVIGAKVSIVTPKVQTTRRRVLGVFIQENTQVAFLDTPGIFTPSTRLDKAMVNVALQAIQEADLVCVIIDACKRLTDHERLLTIAKQSGRPICVVLNKVDKTPKDKLLVLAQTISETYGFNEIFMISALKAQGTEDLLKYINQKMPEGPWLFEEDDLTDLSLQDLATEFTREKLFAFLHQEIPYGLMVQHELWKEDTPGKVQIYQRIVIEKNNHKGIVLGHNGTLIKKVREAAQKDIRQLIQKKVQLFLQVVVKEDWKNKPQYFQDQGLEF